MKIILLQPYQLLSAGDEMDVPKPVADLLIQRGVARPEIQRPANAPNKKPSEVK